MYPVNYETPKKSSRAALWLRVSTEGRGQDPQLQRADLDTICQQRGWEITRVYEVEESAFGKRPRQQFAAMLEDARRARFDVLLVWSMDRFSREGGWSVSRIIASLRDWGVRFVSHQEPFLDTDTPFAEFLAPLFAWLAHQDSVRKGHAVQLGMEKARAQGRHIGRPQVRVDQALVLRLRGEGLSYPAIQRAHPRTRLGPRRFGVPSLRTLARVWEQAQKGRPGPMPAETAV